KRWPRTPHAMAGRLRRASEVLRAKGWAVEHLRSTDKKHARIITITPASPPHEDGMQTSETSERPKSNGNSGLASDDTSDDASDDVGGPALARPIVRPSSDGKSLFLQGNGRTDVSDDVLPTPQGGRCAHCGEAEPPPQTCSWDGKAV